MTAVFPNSQGAGTDGHAAGGRRELGPGVSKDKTALMPRMAEQKDAHWAKLFMENNTGQRWFPLPLLSPAAPARGEGCCWGRPGSGSFGLEPGATKTSRAVPPALSPAAFSAVWEMKFTLLLIF